MKTFGANGNHIMWGSPGQTMIHPVVLVALIIVVILMLSLNRKYVVGPMLILCLTIPFGQVVMVGPFHFTTFRILIVFGWIRLVSQRYGIEGEAAKLKLNGVDWAVLLYGLSSLVCYTFLWQQTDAFISQLGKTYNALGLYFFFRSFIRDQEDVERAIKILAVAATVVAACMFNEQVTGKNILATLGGVPLQTRVRYGTLRSQGPFSVYLTAGSFGATLTPLFVALWRKGLRIPATLGLIASITIAITSETSTAVSALMAAFGAMILWPIRSSMRTLRWGLVAIATVLHIFMKAPVWALLAKVDIVGGSTGWQRFKIVDNFIHHFWDWCLLGANNWWTWDGGDDMWDLANQYVSIGETTGLLSLICFLAAIVYCFKYLGSARKAAETVPPQQWFLWLLGACLFSNLVAFWGISYYDQTSIYWYALLAMFVAAARPKKPKAMETTVDGKNAVAPDPAYSAPVANSEAEVWFSFPGGKGTFDLKP